MTLREAGVELFDCDHRTPPRAVEGIPYVAIPQLQDGRINISDARRISHANFLEWTRKTRPTDGDIVLSRRCNPGETAVVPAGLEFALGQNLVLLRADGKISDAGFLRWAVRSPAWWEEIKKYINVGAIFESLRCRDIPEFTLPFPPIEVQREVARVLDVLDAKIEFMRLQNEASEAIARAIFKSWFVDFDPVRAKAEGREPEGMDAATAALFPSEFEDSVLGSIPQGWKLGTIFDIANLLSGGTPKTSRDDYWGGTIAWASAKDVSQCRQSFLVKTERTITERGLVESSTKLIPAYSTVVVARGATTGRMALLGRDMAMNQTCYALESRLEAPFALHCLIQNLMNQLVHAAHGSVFETITTSTFSGTQILLPPPALLKQCETLIDVLFRRILISTEMIASLVGLRDTLLPRLISGKLRVPEAEKMVEAAL